MKTHPVGKMLLVALNTAYALLLPSIAEDSVNLHSPTYPKVRMPHAMLTVHLLVPSVCLGTMTLPIQREFILD